MSDDDEVLDDEKEIPKVHEDFTSKKDEDSK